MNRLLLTLFIGFFISTAHAQNIEECATDAIHNRLMKNDPEYAARIIENEQLIQQYIKNTPQSKSGTIIRIPLVVHIIHTGQAVGVGANISMTQINSAIDTLNARYRNLQSSSVDTEIEFVLAQRDPNGNATNGVVRVDGSSVPLYATEGISAGGSGANEIDVKNLSRWPNTQYYNVWVVTEIEDNNGLFGIQGYAYFPGASPAVDGTVIMHTCFGTTGTVNSFNNMNRTFVHELGHGLNLYHTFEGDFGGTQCPGAGNLCGSGVGDCVADTDPHTRASSNCPSGTNNCTGTSIMGVTSNFMNYSSQTCAVNYTSGQSTRMRAALQTLRPSLITSLGGTPPDARSPIAAACTPTVHTTNNFGIGVYEFTLNNLTTVSSGQSNEGFYVDQSNHQLISLDEGNSYSISVTTGISNNEDVEVYIDYNGDGDFADAGENVFSSNYTSNTPKVNIHSGTIIVPSSGIQTDSILRLRVISDWYNNTISGPCYNSQYGQTEDYAIVVNSASTPLSVAVNTTDESCFGDNNGTATANASGGDSPYTYVWSNAATSASINGLSPATYSVTVTDNNGSTATASNQVLRPAELVSQILLVKNISAVGAADAELVGWAKGGTLPYTYQWDDPLSQTNRKATNLAAGTYNVTISDANSCTTTASLMVGLGACPPSLTVTNLEAKYLTSSTALIDWDGIIGTNVYYMVRYKESGQSAWQTFFTTSKDSFQLSGLTANTAYLYIVRTNCNGIWGMPILNHFRTLTVDCSNPTNLDEQWVLGTQTKLIWDAAANTSKYEIRYRDTTLSAWNYINLNGRFDFYWLNGLSSGNTYQWQIRSFCRFDEATARPWSNSRYFTTQGGASASSSSRLKIESSKSLEESIYIYPNPSKGLFNMSYEGDIEYLKIQVFDVSGRLVHAQEINSSTKNIQLDFLDEESGVYYINLQNHNEVVVKRIVIQK